MAMKRFTGIGAAPRRSIHLGTKDSALAIARGRICREMLMARHPALAIDLQVVDAPEESSSKRSKRAFGETDLFVQELHHALNRNHIQIAIHAMEELPIGSPPGLLLAAISERGDTRDALVSNGGKELGSLPAGARVGVTSPRQEAQLLAIRSDLEPIRLLIDIEALLSRIDGGALDAAILPAAGLDRLNLGYRITERLDTERFLPSVGQGALGLVVRERDFSNKALAMGLTHVATAMAVDGERALLEAIGGDPRMPIAAHGTVVGGSYRLEAQVLNLDGSRSLRMTLEGFGSVAESVGEELAAAMLEDGAHEILREVREALAA